MTQVYEPAGTGTVPRSGRARRAPDGRPGPAWQDRAVGPAREEVPAAPEPTRGGLMASAAEWIEGARLRTLPTAVSPVVAGTAVGWWQGGAPVAVVALCLVVALGLAIGVNFANDYSDGIRGTDDHRVGPQRLVGSGAADPARVRNAAFGCFGVSSAAGCWPSAPPASWPPGSTPGAGIPTGTWAWARSSSSSSSAWSPPPAPSTCWTGGSPPPGGPPPSPWAWPRTACS